MKKKIFNKWDFVVLIIGLAAVVLGFCYVHYGTFTPSKMHKPQQTPIMFVSDQNRTSQAARHLVTTASRSGGSVAMHIDVLSDGQINYYPNGNLKAKQPIVEVNFSDRSKTTKEQSAALNRILRHLNRKYQYEQYDAIGFGSGSLAVFTNATTYGMKKNQMKLNHFVSVAGPYQGVTVNVPPMKQQPGQTGNGNQPNQGKPNQGHPGGPNPEVLRQQAQERQQAINSRYPSYAEFKRMAKHLDPNTEVLNIYGVIDKRTNSDGRVSAASATSLKHLVPAKNYESLRLTGPMAEHSQILDNQVSERIINRFLFNE
ncbi:alpha/beta hydrolase [Fructilactobacillus myrtifloralis]|uniref:Alpha/beta hydrolase n=1 Tax=Fructilactobacillus myrtifloralis TaxID=2940301 RepID=A0ABY5BPV2_9LACO|nr:alpha/beta hydrolase [Fructilactobacillus myrtifloralis]USS85739.1 alpha/beta hydrolase [Fructilactobacillus myrtifloralis]